MKRRLWYQEHLKELETVEDGGDTILGHQECRRSDEEVKISF
jgi:hypothetical protein